MSETKTFSFAERAKLNEDMQSLQEGPYVDFVQEAERPEAVSKFVEKHKQGFIKQYGDKKKGTSVAFGVAWKQYKAGHLEHVELPEELAALEADLLNSFTDTRASNESCEAKARRIMDFLESR